MRALTIKQPWASLIMAGVKDVENRSWPVPSTLPEHRYCPSCGTRWWSDAPDGRCLGRTDDGMGHSPVPTVADGPYPFRLGIHAGLSWDEDGYADAWVRVGGRSDLLPAAYDHGRVLGTVLVIGCHHAEECWELRGSEHGDLVGPAPDGWHCSPWAEPDVYHWTLTDPEPLAEPIPLRGRQGLWTLPDDVAVPA